MNHTRFEHLELIMGKSKKESSEENQMFNAIWDDSFFYA